MFDTNIINHESNRTFDDLWINCKYSNNITSKLSHSYMTVKYLKKKLIPNVDKKTYFITDIFK